MTLASNTIFASRSLTSDPAVLVEERQAGCVRFCFVPLGSRVPQRHRCLPEEDSPDIWPSFTSLRLGDPAIGQLSFLGPKEISTGSDDEAELGLWHDLFRPHRTAYLSHRLQEYLRLGMEAGVVPES